MDFRINFERHKPTALLKDIDHIIQGCIRGDRFAQEKLYCEYFNYAMTVCIPYTNTVFEAEEMANDGFIKVFDKIRTFDISRTFTPWFRRIMINSAIDHIRSQRKHYMSEDIDERVDITDDDLSIIDRISADELIDKIRELTPAYRTTFLLYVVEGMKHHEIAEQLGIAEGTSKSNLAKAKKKLQELLKNWGDE